jgi:hypothetical protein
MTTLESLSVKLDLDSAGVQSGLDDTSSAFDSFSSGMQSGADKLDANFGKIALAGAAAGAALEGFARKQAPMTEGLGRISHSTGIASDELRTLAKDTSNVTFPLEEAIGLMELGAQQGLDSADALQQYATFWDTLGDATGESSESLAKAGVALRGVGIDAGNESEALASFGFITENTTGSVGDFLKFLERTGPELRDMGVDIDDAAGLLGAMEHELGMTGRTARSEFRKAVTESDGDLSKMLETLGLSEDQFAKYRGEVEKSGDTIQDLAKEHEQTYTGLQKLQHEVGEMLFSLGDYGDIASALALPLLALGPISKAVAGAFRLVGSSAVINAAKTSAAWVANMARVVGGLVVTAASFVVQGAIMAGSMAATAARVVAGWVLMGVQSLIQAARMAAAWLIAMGPVGWVIAAVIGLVALIIANWDTVKRVTIEVWNAVWKWVSDRLTDIRNWVQARLRDVMSFFGWLGSLPGRVAGWIGSVKDAIVRKFQEAVNWVRGIPGRILGALGNLGSLLWNAGSSIISGLLGGLKSAAQGVFDFVGGIAGKIASLKGPIPYDRTLLIPAGNAIMDGLFGGLDDGLRPVLGLVSSMAGDIEDEFGSPTLGVDGPSIPSPRVPGGGRVGRGGREDRLVLDVTGADEDWKRLMRKLIRAEFGGDVTKLGRRRASA